MQVSEGVNVLLLFVFMVVSFYFPLTLLYFLFVLLIAALNVFVVNMYCIFVWELLKFICVIFFMLSIMVQTFANFLTSLLSTVFSRSSSYLLFYCQIFHCIGDC